MSVLVRPFARWVTHPRFGLHLAGLAVLLMLPTLWVGWQLDDHTFRYVMMGQGEPGMTPLRAFDLVRGDAAINTDLIDRGYLPWWTPADFRIAFFRYLTVLTMWVDYQLWPNSPVLMHAQNLFWFALVAAIVVMFYRQMFGPTVAAGLAALLYALDDARAVPVAWLANRNALTATAFGLLCLWAHDRWRRDGWRAGALLGPAFLALSLASAEMGLGTVAYLVAHMVFLDRGAVWRRLAALAPCAGVLTIWAVVYHVLGYGVSGSALYLDPIGDPIAYLGALPHRLVFDLLGQWTPIPAEAGAFLADDVQRVLWVAGLVAICAIAWALAPRLRRDRLARFWAMGMLLSLLPIAGTFPANRLLMFVGLGGMGLVATFLVDVFGGRHDRAAWLPQAGARRLALLGFGWILLASHLVIGPVGLALGSTGTRTLGETETTAIASIPSDPDIASQDLVVVNAPEFLLYVMHIPTLKFLAGEPAPRHVRALVPAPVPLSLRRLDDRTLDVRLGGGLFAGPFGLLFRDDRRPFRTGDQIDLTGLTITILDATPTGDVRELRFAFGVPLEDPSLRWVRWDSDQYASFTPPPIGETVELPAAQGFIEQLR